MRTTTIESTSFLARFYPVEEQFLKDWFARVIFAYETYGKDGLTAFENKVINYEFGQKDYNNSIEFDGHGGAVLKTQKMIVDYHSRKGYFGTSPSIQIIRRQRKRSLQHLYN